MKMFGCVLLLSTVALILPGCPLDKVIATEPDGGREGAGDGSPDAKHATDSGTPADVNGPPFLVELSVATSSPPLELVPTFSPDVHDYYVRCAAGVNSVSLSMTASPGAESLLIQPTTSSGLPHQTLSVSVSENEALVAAATDKSTTVEYWVRCLPHDFPPIKMDAHPAAGAPTPGYYLVGTANPTGSEAGYAMVLTGDGVPVWYYRESSGGVSDVDSVVKGNISFFGVVGPSLHAVQLSPFAAKVVAPTGELLADSEFRVLPNGNDLVISNPIQTGVDLTGLAVPLDDSGIEALGPNSNILSCNIVEFEPTGAIVWTWIAADHFDPAKDSTDPIFATPLVDGGLVVDTFHCDSIDVDPATGNLLVSARQMDSVFYIERSTGNVLWKMGGASSSRDNAAYVPVADPFFRPSDARLLPGWSTCAGGQVSLFDGEAGKPGPARAVVYDVRVATESGSCDGGSAGATLAWQYKGAVHSLAEGSLRILADGSRTIGWGIKSEPGPGLVFTEVDVSGHDLLDFYFTSGESSSRAIKVPLTALDLSVMRATAGHP